jgi:hypothetical protein
MPLASSPKEIVIDIPALYSKQKYVRENAERYNVLAWGRRSGKTTFGTDLVIETVLDQRQPLGWFAPDFKILDPVWNYYVKLFAPLTIDKDETKRYLELQGGGIFECWSMQSGIVARSRKYKRAILDEAAYVGDLKKRLEYEVMPTLIDLTGDLWLFSSTNGDDEFKTYFDMGQNPNEPEWFSNRVMTWENPFLPKKERDRVFKLAEVDRDPMAQQEYGAEFKTGKDNFVKSQWVDACLLNADRWKPLDPRSPICVGIDVAAKNDLFSITGWGRSQAEYDEQGNLLKPQKYKPMFSKLFYPEELTTYDGRVTFDKPKEFLRNINRSYQVLEYSYDPYQAWGLADDMFKEGIATFREFPQGQQRVLSDSLFYTLIRDSQIEMNFHDQGNKELAEHIKNADVKIVGEDKRRMEKRKDDLKIDSAVSSSMAIWALQSWSI